MAVSAGVSAEALPSRGENALKKCWSLEPEAEKEVDEMRRLARNYRPRVDRTHIFSRAQLKYGLQRTDFIHRWYDRPLHQNSSWAKTANPARIIHPEAWKKTVEDVKLGGMDGLAVCTALSRCDEVIPMSVSSGGELPILVELPYAYADKGLESHMKAAETALKMPNSFRIGGRVVLTRYPAIKENGLDFAEKLRRSLDAKFGPGKFIVMFYIEPFGTRPADKPLTAAQLQGAREHLRRCLRKMDGILVTGWDIYYPRRYGAAFERGVLLPLYQSVLAEPEFAGKKYLGMTVTPGHENCYRWSYDIDSQGTRTLVERMKTMAVLRPVFIIGCEWDEQNENTFFRPTVANGFTHQRIIRHFADSFAGREHSIFPGDSPCVPNLVVSYRRSLIAGEPIEVEVLNIPDGTFKGESFRCRFRWLDLNGRTVKEYRPAALGADSLGSVFFVSPVTELVSANRVLIPSLEIETSGGGKFTFGQDFWPLDLNAARALDTKWVKHSLRDRPEKTLAALRASRTADGGWNVEGRFKSQGLIKSVEVLRGPDTVYMFDPAAKDRRGMEIVKIAWQARGNAPRSLAPSGTVRFVNAPGVEIITGKGRGRKPLVDGWKMDRALYCNWATELFAAVPAAVVDKAEVVVDLSPVFGKLRFKVKDILERQIVGVSGPAGGNLVLSREFSQLSMPEPCNVQTGGFSFCAGPLGKSEVLRMQIVDDRGRVWRGGAVVLGQDSGRMRTIEVFERDEGSVTKLRIDSSRFDEARYCFDPSRGSVVWGGASRDFGGIFGGAATMVTGFGQGESNYGDTLTRYIMGKEFDALENAPGYVQGPDGAAALCFDGSDYLMLPQQLVSKFAGFEISLDVCPDSIEGEQTLVDGGYHAYSLFLRDGVPEARMWLLKPNAIGPSRLESGKWSEVKLVYDLKNVQISVDGIDGVAVPHSGCQFQARYTAVGAANRMLRFFRGRIANLRFRLK